MTVVLILTISFANILRLSSGREGLEGMEDKEAKEGLKEGGDDTLKSSDAGSDKKSKSSATSTGGERTKSEMVDDVKKEAMELIDTQNKIIGGFEKIDPYMKQAEKLIANIDSTAKKIDGINKTKVDQYRTSN